MSDVFVGQIMMAGFAFAPRGFAACNGQLLPVQQNAALFALLGTQFGGNGQSTFGLPDLRGRTPFGSGASVDGSWQPSPLTQGTPAGSEAVTLLVSQLPAHNHAASALTTAGTLKNPAGALYAGSGAESIYVAATGPQVALAQQTLATTGGNGPHNNLQPFRVINFNIALSGVYPSRN
ncbi:tail fiber protein [Janthinobacterium sp. SUN026]|uniref:phage tail protein n=1 Tax=unclassified Janthinobacterium TaxID=2610881 RepID=UPI0025B5298E|nr:MULTISPECIES: tail fiber protein [unclassified Janthinobacterium]MDN2670832.1 tail fiber protein [Janthinobacterium sp. SUN026]MDN2702141.1 tail fiber protein [Janthinobacterium sp. SUN100]